MQGKLKKLWTRRLLGGALGWSVIVGHAAAQNIVEPEVTKGQTKLETFSQFQPGFNGGAAGDTREIHAPSYSYGLTDFWQIKAVLALERPSHQGYTATHAIIENTFELVNAKKAGGIGLGWFTGLAAAVDTEHSNAVVSGPIIRLGAGSTSLILNSFVEKTYGQNREDGFAFLYGWQLKHEVHKGFWLGVEGFGAADIFGARGPERHRIGPLMTWEWEVADKRSLTFETGVLLGLTDATPDGAVKMQMTFTY